MLVFITLYVNDMVIVFVSSCLNIFRLPTATFGKKTFKSLVIFSSMKSKLSVVICSKINALKPPPKEGFRGLSPGLVKK